MNPALHILLSHHPQSNMPGSGGMAEGGPVDGDEMPDAMHAIASELIDAVHSQDPERVAECLEDAFEYLDAQPHEEADEGE